MNSPMKMENILLRKNVTSDPWNALRNLTNARIALGRSGTSLPLQESLAFRLDHARARDAVHTQFQISEIMAELQERSISCLELTSEAKSRNEYLTRPDKGRKLSKESKEMLGLKNPGYDICFVIADGLSARAINEQAVDFTVAATDLLHSANLSCSPVCIVKNGRVAVGDEIATLLAARMVVVLIGERPGLSSPNSMGLYLTMHPIPGTTDENRNCISNIHGKGLPLKRALHKFCYLVEEAQRLDCTGIFLKDRMPQDYLPFGLVSLQ